MNTILILSIFSIHCVFDEVKNANRWLGMKWRGGGKVGWTNCYQKSLVSRSFSTEICPHFRGTFVLKVMGDLSTKYGRFVHKRRFTVNSEIDDVTVRARNRDNVLLQQIFYCFVDTYFRAAYFAIVPPTIRVRDVKFRSRK